MVIDTVRECTSNIGYTEDEDFVNCWIQNPMSPIAEENTDDFAGQVFSLATKFFLYFGNNLGGPRKYNWVINSQTGEILLREDFLKKPEAQPLQNYFKSCEDGSTNGNHRVFITHPFDVDYKHIPTWYLSVTNDTIPFEAMRETGRILKLRVESKNPCLESKTPNFFKLLEINRAARLSKLKENEKTSLATKIDKNITRVIKNAKKRISQTTKDLKTTARIPQSTKISKNKRKKIAKKTGNAASVEGSKQPKRKKRRNAKKRKEKGATSKQV